ncbi:unnamed protein product, partial [Pylaiella littoralis]
KISHSRSQKGQVHQSPSNAFSQWYRLKSLGGPSPRNTEEIEYTGVWRGPLFLAGPTTFPLHIHFGLNTLFRYKPTTPFIANWPALCEITCAIILPDTNRAQIYLFQIRVLG